jgi:hypothetical protein
MDGFMVGWLAELMEVWRFERLDDWLYGWKAGWMVGWLFGWLDGWLAGWLIWMFGLNGWWLCSGPDNLYPRHKERLTMDPDT